MSLWVVEPPDTTGTLPDDCCRIIEVDDDDRFVRVIAKLHNSISTDAAAVFAAVIEMYVALKKIYEDVGYRDEPEHDDEHTTNDRILLSIEEECERVLESIEQRKH